MTTFKLYALTLSAVLAGSLPLGATEVFVTQWNDVCSAAAGRELILHTNKGETVYGYCSTMNADSIALYTDGRVVTIARSALSRMHMRLSKTPQSHQLRSLGHGMKVGLRQGSDWLLSPYAPLGVVTIPATLAWGAASAPFCLIGDLAKRNRAAQVEIRVK